MIRRYTIIKRNIIQTITQFQIKVILALRWRASAHSSSKSTNMLLKASLYYSNNSLARILLRLITTVKQFISYNRYRKSSDGCGLNKFKKIGCKLA